MPSGSDCKRPKPEIFLTTEHHAVPNLQAIDAVLCRPTSSAQVLCESDVPAQRVVAGMLIETGLPMRDAAYRVDVD